jgi:hypothetical protein
VRVFLENSRYFNVKTVQTENETGRSFVAVMLRRLPYVAATPIVMKGNDRLDVIAQRKYNDPTKFWHVADANTELEATNLVTQRPQEEEVITINVPEK